MDYQYDVQGAPVIFSTGHKHPDNPLRRPEVHYRKMILTIVGFIVFMMIVFFAGGEIEERVPAVHRGVFCAVAAGVYILAVAKRAVICLVHLYQSKAPDDVRLKCVFEPSCSEYMILAVEKYGAIIGVIKGIRRLGRCHAPNGGKDYP